MELTKTYEGRRFEIIYGSYTGMEKNAVDLVQSAVKRYVPYILALYTNPTGKACPIYVGTKESNPHIHKLLSEVELPADATYVKVYGEGDAQTVIVSGGSEAACYYAAVEFADEYLPDIRRRRGWANPYFIKPFIDDLPACEHLSRPLIKERGLWTWGHVIYDYRRYLDNMARLKMNKITVWNDFAPVNGREFVDYAHSLGIRVIWGYSWMWDEKPEGVVTNPELRKTWKEKILANYQGDYAHLGGDGIYFQTFTETGVETIEGRNRAECAVEWVNEVAEALLALYPDLKIEFGLHATSVKNSLEEIARTDERLSIIWEDCGAFPYEYSASLVETAAETEAFSRKIASLRGGKGFGAVLKGMSWLDWSSFAHQTGPYLLGVSEKQEMEEKLPLRRDILRNQTSFWLENGEYAFRMIRLLAEASEGSAEICGLLEDGLFEEKPWLPAVLFGRMLWDGESDYQTLLGKAARTENWE